MNITQKNVAALATSFSRKGTQCWQWVWQHRASAGMQSPC